MKQSIILGLALVWVGAFAGGSALAQEVAETSQMAGSFQAASVKQKALASHLPKTVVVRVSKQTGAAEVLETTAALKADATEVAKLNDQSFQPVDVNATVKGGGELDSYVSRDSWGRGWNRGNWGGRWGGGGWGGNWGGYGYNPGYSYYGYNYYYQPYYSCYNPYYSYYYYGWY